MCKECKVPANGNKMHYKYFEELTDDLINKFQSKAKGIKLDDSKKAYVDFINKLNKKGDKLVSDYINATTKVRIHYAKCGHIHPEEEGVEPHSYKRGNGGCGICDGKIVVEGVNDLASKHPELAKEWHPTRNEDLKPTQVSLGSNKKVWWLCECGHEWEAQINNRTSNNTGCPSCGDGISRPEKVLALLLNSLNIKFKKQLKIDEHKFLYDFYLIDYGIIIEVHGEQHYKYTGFTRLYEEEHENDLIKYDIAVLNGYEYNKNYFVIDARESNIKWLRNSISYCLFFQQFDLSNINWKEIDIQAQKSLKVEACLYWKEQKEINKDLTTTIMAEMFNVDRNTIRSWLTWGDEDRLCTYSGEEESKVRTKRYSKFVYLIKPDGTKEYDEAMSQRELTRLTGIGRDTIKYRLKDGEPIKGNSKYKGCYIIEAK